MGHRLPLAKGAVDTLGIRLRIAGSFLIVVLLTVVIMEACLLLFVRSYYYGNVKRTLYNHAELSAAFYQQYLSDERLEAQAGRLQDSFSDNIAAQVQIIDASARLLADTNGNRQSDAFVATPDLLTALAGSIGVWRGKESATGEPVLAVAAPLKISETTVGAVRFVTSLYETNRTVDQITILLVLAGCAVVIFVALLGILLARTITNSIRELKRATQRMAAGDFSVRVRTRYRDELGALAETLNRMAEITTRNERLKSDFVSSVSHELRTPLTSIKGWAVTLRTAGNMDAGLREEGLAIIEAESDRLTGLVEELLDFSKWEAGAIDLAPALVALPDLIRQIERQLAPRAARQGVTIEVEIAEPLPAIRADESRLKQVLINLLDNALKFTSHGGFVRICANRADGQVMISVEDSGSGIPERDLAHVFHKFYKVDQRMAGSGLGLAISERIVKLHNGTMTIQSKIGVGTRVEIRLPVNMQPGRGSGW